MQPVGSDAIQIVARHFEDRDARIGCQPYGFSESLVSLGAKRDEQRGGWHAGPQALQHGIAAKHDLGVVGLTRRPPLLLLGLGRPLRRGMVGPLMRGRGGAPSPQSAATDTP